MKFSMFNIQRSIVNCFPIFCHPALDAGSIAVTTKSRVFARDNKQQGQSLIELLIAIALAGLLLPALIGGFYASQGGRAQQDQRIAAINLARETEEAVRVVRDKDWSLFSTDGIYYPTASGTSWTLSPGPEPTRADGFTRTVEVSSVYRNSSGFGTVTAFAPTPIPAGSVLDPSTKKITVTVAWANPIPNSVSSTEYLTRFINLPYTETLKSDFDAPFLAGIPETNVKTEYTVPPGAPDGDVILTPGSAGGSDWCAPSLTLNSVDLSRQGIPTSISAYSANNIGYVVTGTGGNASGPTFVNTTITNDGQNNNFIGQFNNAKANQVFTESHFGYIATTNNSQEIQILDLSQFSSPQTFKQVGSFNAPGNGEGDSVNIVGNTGYMSYYDSKNGPQFYTFSVSSNRTITKQLNTATIALAGKGTKVLVVGNYAYIAENSTTTQVEVYDITDPTNPKKAGYAQIGNNQQGVDLWVNTDGSKVYVVTKYASGVNDFFILNSQNKSTTTPVKFPILTSANTNGTMPTGITVVGGETRAIIVGTGGSLQYQVFDLTKSPLGLCTNPVNGNPAGLSIPSGAFAVTSVSQLDTNVFSYVVTGDTHAELKVIQGGSGGGAGSNFQTSGLFFSQIVDLGQKAGTNKAVLLNNFFIDQVLNSEKLTYYVGLQKGPCSGASFTFPTDFVGPYTLSSGQVQTLPFTGTGKYANPGQCLEYVVSFSSDGKNTPVFNDVTFNYSP